MHMEAIEQAVKELLIGNDGHGFDHVERVRDLAMRFAKQENANLEVVELASLLHEVDDYKLFGEENAKRLLNARRILDENTINDNVQSQVIEIITTMGYSKSLEGIRPSTLEGRIVSDADMCDAIGAVGILRTYAYALSKGNKFFDRTLAPVKESVSAKDYKTNKKSHSVQHFFDKLLLIPSMLMTEAGQREGISRKNIMTSFLRELFEEEGARDWADFLEVFIKQN